MLLVPSCSTCRSPLHEMESKAAMAFVRLRLKEYGFTKSTIDEAVLREPRRMRLLCAGCDDKYIVAGEDRLAVACLCDAPMARIDERPPLPAHQWLRVAWYCEACDFRANVQRLLEAGSVFVWHEKDRMLTRKVVPARSKRRSG